MKMNLKPVKTRKPHSSSSSTTTATTMTQNNLDLDLQRRFSLPNPRRSPSILSEIDALNAAFPFTPSSHCGIASSSTEDIPVDFSRASAEFYTPTYQAMKNSTFFSNPNKQRDKTKRLSNASSLYESTILDGYDHEVMGILPSVPEEFGLLPRNGVNGSPKSANRENLAKATPVDCHMSHRPKPYQEFLEEVQCQKQQAEVDASRKRSCTNLLRKLRIKEDAIDAWESKQKCKVEDQLDKLERRLEKKRAKAVQRTHRKLVDTEEEAEKRKAIARRAVLKEMSKLHITS